MHPAHARLHATGHTGEGVLDNLNESRELLSVMIKHNMSNSCNNLTNSQFLSMLGVPGVIPMAETEE